MDKTVDEYIGKQQPPKKEICKKLRQIILDTFPGITEEMKWGVPVYDGGKFYIGTVRSGVNLGFSMGGLSENEMNKFNGKGSLMRHIKILDIKDIDKNHLVTLLHLVKKP